MIFASCSVADGAVTKTEAPLRTSAGVFGITRTILASLGSNLKKTVMDNTSFKTGTKGIRMLDFVIHICQ